MAARQRRLPRGSINAPTMSDKVLLVTVEDLIYTAFGPSKENTVNFKLLQRVLHILARQMRLLEQDVEIKLDEIISEEDESGTYSSSSAEGNELSKEVRGIIHKRNRAEREQARKKEKGDKKKPSEEGEKEKHKGRRGKGEKRDGKGRSKDRESRGHSKDRERGGHSKDRERKGRSKDKETLDFGRQTSGTSITVSEAARMGTGGSADKILVAERGPATRVRPARIGSIEVVTASQFALLAKAVMQLMRITGPLPEPVLPDNDTLRQDLAKGRASLQDTMQAMQLNARVQAAEHGLQRLAELLTQLAQSGVMPPEFAGQVGAIEEYLQAATAAGHAAEPGGIREDMKVWNDVGRHDGISQTGTTASQMKEKKSTASVLSESLNKFTGVTHCNMHEVLNQMKEDLFKEIINSTTRANRSADMASNISRNIAEKLDIAMQVNGRVNTLFQLTEDYGKQLGGLDSGVKSQVDNLEGQLVMMRTDLAEGLALLDAANNNAETAALLELKEHLQDVVIKFENTVHLHQNLLIAQQQNSNEIMNLLKCVEILRDEKADRDEVLDSLSDKANISRLAGMMYEKDFTYVCSKIERRIAKFYENFVRQDIKWREALSELMAIADNKAEITNLMSLKDATNRELNAIQKQLHVLEIMLGEPKAAMLMRALSKNATCGACMTRALMEPEDATYGKPLPLPALRPPPVGAEQQPCFHDVKLAPPDTRDHTCRRWVGGSHTLIAGNIVKVKPEYTKLQTIPTKKFDGTGSDGRYYMMEEDMQPCAECNKLITDQTALVSPQSPTPIGSGDQVSAPTRRR